MELDSEVVWLTGSKMALTSDFFRPMLCGGFLNFNLPPLWLEYSCLQLHSSMLLWANAEVSKCTETSIEYKEKLFPNSQGTNYSHCPPQGYGHSQPIVGNGTMQVYLDTNCANLLVRIICSWRGQDHQEKGENTGVTAKELAWVLI